MARLSAEPRYTDAFRATYGDSIGELTVQHVTRALAAFERTLVSQHIGTLPFDRFLQGRRDAMAPAAREGWMIFDQRAHCTRCHVVATGDRQAPMFTDHQFHSLAIGFSKIERKLPQLTERIVALRRDGNLLGGDLLIDRELAELGRFAATLEPRDVATFKTPSLRNVATGGQSATLLPDGQWVLQDARHRAIHLGGSGRRLEPLYVRRRRPDRFHRSEWADVQAGQAFLERR